MEWQQLIGFYHVARLGSFTLAAKATFRTQSALSQQVKTLESELGCQLLERIGKRKLLLTEAGQLLFQFASDLLEKHDHFQDHLSELKQKKTGSLTVAAPFTTLYHLFPDRITEVRLTILDRSQQEVIELVQKGEVDFGFALESMISEAFEIYRCHSLETMLLTPKNHPLTRIKQVNWSDIALYPLILPPADLKYPARILLEDYLRKSGLECHILMESSNVEINSRFVERGVGISFATVSQDISGLKGLDIEFIRLNHYLEPDFLSAFTRKGKMLPTYKKNLLDRFRSPNQDGAPSRPLPISEVTGLPAPSTSQTTDPVPGRYDRTLRKWSGRD